MKKGFSLGLFLLLDLTILFTAYTFFSLLEGKGHQNANQVLSASVQATYTALPQTSEGSEAEIISGDARSAIIDSFLKKYKSPMSGLGETMVNAADRYQLPFWIVPAIAQCESNLGKVMPPGSFNGWGWGIYGEKVTHFASWEDGVETVSKGLRSNYFDKGIDTPEEIMKKYTPSSKGSWASCVNEFLQELK